MLRLIGILVTVLSTITLAVLTFPTFFRVEQRYPIAQIIAFRGPITAAIVVLLVIVLFLAIARPLRGFAVPLAIVLAVAAALNIGIGISRGTGTDTLPEKTDSSIRVLTWNTAGEATPADTIARIAVAMDADIVTLPETTIETGAAVAVAMRDLGHPMWAHHAEYGTTPWDAGSTTMLISPDLGDYSVIDSSTDGSNNTSTVPSAVAMPISGDGPIVVAVHAVAPRPEYMDRWSADLRWIADQCGTENVILAGDFNATIDHMGGLGSDGGVLGGCHDAAIDTGNGAVGTWPSDIPALAGAPIDHVMATRGWVPTGSLVLRSTDSSGSDHRPLVVQLERR